MTTTSALLVSEVVGVFRIHDDPSNNRNFLMDRSRLQKLKLLGNLHHLYERAQVSLQCVVEAHLGGGNDLGNVTKPLRILDTDGLEKGVAEQLLILRRSAPHDFFPQDFMHI